MARQPRVDYPGAFHHVMNGGVNGAAIFQGPEDRLFFLELMAESFEDHGVEIHAYALMTTHFHVLVESTAGELSTAMKTLGANYSQQFNAKHERYGPLFRSRFTSKLIETAAYFETASRYVHLNPLDTGVADLSDYVWSSWPAFIGAVPQPPWLNTAFTIAHFGSLEAYTRFVLAGSQAAA